MEEKQMYMKLLLYSSYLLIFIGVLKTALCILNHEVSELALPVLILVVGVLFLISYKNMSTRK